jgi:hypothetical protein
VAGEWRHAEVGLQQFHYVADNRNNRPGADIYMKSTYRPAVRCGLFARDIAKEIVESTLTTHVPYLGMF